MRFTPAEARFLQHRLEVPDAISDCLEEEYPDSEKRIWAICDRLCSDLRQGEGFEADMTDPLIRAIVEDALEGTTLVSIMREELAFGDLTPQAFAAEMSVVRRLEKKVGVRVEND